MSENMSLLDTTLFSRLYLKLNLLTTIGCDVNNPQTDDKEVSDSSSSMVASIDHRDTNRIEDANVSFLYYYGQFPSNGAIFIGHFDGSISMVLFQKTTPETPLPCEQPKRFTFVDPSRKRQCHQAAITGILCFSTVSNVHLLVTSCADGNVKFWHLDTTRANDETKPSVWLFDLGNTCKLGSKVVCLKFVFNDAYYSSLEDKDLLRAIFHMVAICENGNIYGWDPMMVNKFHMTGVDMYKGQNIFELLKRGNIYRDDDLCDGSVQVTSAILSQKITTDRGAYVVCGLSNGEIIQCELSFDKPNKNYGKDNYFITNASQVLFDYPPCDLTRKEIRKLVEVSPMSPDHNFQFLRGGVIYNLSVSNNFIWVSKDLSTGDEEEKLISLGEENCHLKGREEILVRNVAQPIPTKNLIVKKPFIPRESCWIFRNALFCISNERGDLLFLNTHDEVGKWYEICCNSYSLFKLSQFIMKKEKQFSDLLVETLH